MEPVSLSTAPVSTSTETEKKVVLQARREAQTTVEKSAVSTSESVWNAWVQSKKLYAPETPFRVTAYYGFNSYNGYPSTSSQRQVEYMTCTAKPRGVYQDYTDAILTGADYLIVQEFTCKSEVNLQHKVFDDDTPVAECSMQIAVGRKDPDNYIPVTFDGDSFLRVTSSCKPLVTTKTPQAPVVPDAPYYYGGGCP